MQHTLRADNLYKSYNKRIILNNVSIAISSNQIVGLLGPNGAGKTTCFYIICGLVSDYKGSVFIDNNNISSLPMHKRSNLGLAYLPQDASIFRKLSVEKNIMAILQLRQDLTKQQQQQHLDKLLNEFSITHIRTDMGYSLSGGERRRVEIARALAINPKFILLDEPFAGVDPLSIVAIQNIINKLKNKGIGVLITDHNYREMLDTCDYSYVLSDGKIIAQGDKENILNDEIVRKVYLGDNY